MANIEYIYYGGMGGCTPETTQTRIYPNGKIIRYKYSAGQLIKETSIATVTQIETDELYGLFSDDIITRAHNEPSFLATIIGFRKNGIERQWVFQNVPDFLEPIDTNLDKILDSYI